MGTISAAAVIITATVVILLLMHFFIVKKKQERRVNVGNLYASPNEENTIDANEAYLSAPYESEEPHIYATPTLDSAPYYATIAETNPDPNQSSKFGMKTNECYITSSANYSEDVDADDIYSAVI